MAQRAVAFDPELIAADTVDAHAYRLAGLLIVALVPAAFWVGLVALSGYVLDYSVSPVLLTTIGASIATFLVLVMKALTAPTVATQTVAAQRTPALRLVRAR